MKMTEVREHAKRLGVKFLPKKADLIRRIQEAESNEPCFGSKQKCSEADCCWRDDCLTDLPFTLE